MKNYSAVADPKDIATKEYVDSNINTVKEQVAENNTDIMNKVDFKRNQYLSEAEKQQARNNIGAGTSNFSGSYNSLTDKPTIPTELSQLGSDSTHQTVTALEKTTWNNKSNFSGSYNDLTNKPSTFPPSYHTQSASSISGGTFTGTVYANSNGQNPDSYCLRNSKLSNAGEKPTVNGQVIIGYDGKPSIAMVGGTVYPIGQTSGGMHCEVLYEGKFGKDGTLKNTPDQYDMVCAFAGDIDMYQECYTFYASHIIFPKLPIFAMIELDFVFKEDRYNNQIRLNAHMEANSKTIKTYDGHQTGSDMNIVIIGCKF